MATTLYLRLGVAAGSGITLPSGLLGTWGVNGASSYSGANAKALSVTAGSAQVATSGYTNTSTSAVATAQFVSPPMAAVSIASGSWTLSWAMKSASVTWSAQVYIALINGSTGAARTVVSNSGSSTPITVGTTART